MSSSRRSNSRRHTLPLSSRNNCNNNTVNKDYSLSLLPYFAYLNLTISSMSTIYRAYIHNDLTMIIFIVFVYFAYFMLDHCFTAFNKLPPNDNSQKKEFLKFTICVLSTSILFGFACQFATFLSLAASLSIFLVVIASSFCLFYVYFVYDDAKMFRSSRPKNEKVSSKKTKQAKPFSEIV
ncbi:hypothetical protein ACB094_01G280800 [Castanea mollissima]